MSSVSGSKADKERGTADIGEPDKVPLSLSLQEKEQGLKGNREKEDVLPEENRDRETAMEEMQGEQEAVMRQS